MTDKNEIIALEKRFWQTMLDKDVETATAMMAKVSVVTGAQGAAAIDNTAFAGMMTAGNWKLEDYAFSDIHVAFPADDVAVIAYKVAETLMVGEERITMQAADASTWVRQDGDWKCALHTESLLGDPYGRDRQKPAG